MSTFDASSHSRTSGGSSLTFAHTCAGANRGLALAVVGDASSDLITGATYAGSAMTLVAKGRNQGRWLYLFYLNAPATGANNIVVNASASIYIEGDAASYTGVAQTGQPEANSTFADSAGATSWNTSVTTISADARVVAAALAQAGTITAGAGTTLRATDLVGALIDSGVDYTTAGSKTLVHNQASSNVMGGIAMSLAAAPSGPVLSGTVTTDDGVASGSMIVASTVISGTVTADDAVASGTAQSEGNALTGAVAADNAVASGSFGSSTGTVVSQQFRSTQTRQLMPLAAVGRAVLLHVSDGIVAVNLPSVTTGSDSRLTINSTGLTPGADYQLAVWNADGTLVGIEKVTAA